MSPLRVTLNWATTEMTPPNQMKNRMTAALDLMGATLNHMITMLRLWETKGLLEKHEGKVSITNISSLSGIHAANQIGMMRIGSSVTSLTRHCTQDNNQAKG